MQVNSISNYSLGVSKNNYNNKNVKISPTFTAGNIPSQAAKDPFKNPITRMIMKFSIKCMIKVLKPLQKPEVNEKITEMTPEAKQLYERVQKKCDGKFLFYSREKSPELKQMAEEYRKEEIESAKKAKKS